MRMLRAWWELAGCFGIVVGYGLRDAIQGKWTVASATVATGLVLSGVIVGIILLTSIQILGLKI
ncbi:MAG: hypothetical protein HYR90_03420 [Candidatus Andersenbacteria bacterium]|nr:hypothetical protein [Candidatus Andersenbacteria bacterium]MBI3250315.1 hypothetical protein [Candidatus Andersenbacteria bacterium]